MWMRKDGRRNKAASWHDIDVALCGFRAMFAEWETAQRPALSTINRLEDGDRNGINARNVLTHGRMRRGERISVNIVRARKTIRKLCKEIKETLKNVPDQVDLEFGLQCDPIPKPIVKLYAKICLYRKRKAGRKNERIKKSNKRFHHNGPRTSKRDKT